MKRIIEIYKGREINEEKITKLKSIAMRRCAKSIYESYYWSMENIDNFALEHGVNVDDEILILGEDWFLCYAILDNTVIFLEWIAIDDKKCKFVQSVEMMNTLKRIIIQHRDKQFKTDMRHDSSYRVYSKMLQDGYFEESLHEYKIDYCYGYAPERLKYIADDYASLEEFLNSTEAMEHPEYLKYILHCLEFSVTDKLLSKCPRLEKSYR